MNEERELSATKWAEEACEHYAGDYATSACTYSTPKHPADSPFEGPLKGNEGFLEVLKEAYIAGWRAARGEDVGYESSETEQEKKE